MQLTIRAIILLIVAAPFIAAGVWFSDSEILAGIYLLVCLGVFYIDWRLAQNVDRFEIKRLHDTKLSLGVDNPINLVIRNRGRRKTQLWVRDEAPDKFIIDQHILGGEIEGRQTWNKTYHVRPVQRGNYEFGNINLRWQGPLGLIKKQAAVEAVSTVKVYPNLLNIRQYDLLLRQNRLQEMGLRHTRMFGEGTEYERLREYLPDDDYRRINWKATARRNRPITTEYQTERSQNVMLALDTGRMMQSPIANIAKLDYVINTALLLTYVATGKGDKVGLMTFADDIGLFISPKQGRGQFNRILEMLYAVQSQPVEPSYGRAFSYLALKLRKRSLIVIFTDLSGGLSMQSLVSRVSVISRNSLPLVVTISDPEIHAAARQQPQESFTTYQRSIATQFLDERRIALDTLKYHGIFTLDVPANQLSTSVINQYLELRGKRFSNRKG